MIFLKRIFTPIVLTIIAHPSNAVATKPSADPVESPLSSNRTIKIVPSPSSTPTPNSQTLPATGMDVFECRQNEDCVPIRNGCGLAKIFAKESQIHDRHKCVCIRKDRLRFGCYREDNGPNEFEDPPQTD